MVFEVRVEVWCVEIGDVTETGIVNTHTTEVYSSHKLAWDRCTQLLEEERDDLIGYWVVGPFVVKS